MTLPAALVKEVDLGPSNGSKLAQAQRRTSIGGKEEESSSVLLFFFLEVK
jgi:hypothetical protein